MEFVGNDEVVISGVGGLFPKSTNIDDLKNHLLGNEDLLTSRWKEGERGVTNKIGVAPNVEFFDTLFFGIHRHQAIYMDPMQRMILERTFEAIVDAGINPAEIRGRKVGVYMGSAIGENDNVFYDSITSGFGVTGHSRAMMSNRISYWLNLKGPSCSYDSNWVSGFEVLQLAFHAINNGHVEAAIVGTANLALNSEISMLYNDMGVLSPDGVTRSFDVDANGYARSDGFVVFYLQRATKARRIYASILNVATQYTGNRAGSYLDVDVPCMVDFLDEFFKKSNVKPNDVEYLETYGSGVKYIDKAELDAIDEIYCKNRDKPLQVGCIKGHTGHAEAASVMFGIVKVLIAMEYGIIPKTLNYNSPNPNISALVNGRIQVLSENTKYNGGIIAVNGLGLSSSMGHILLKPNSKLKIVPEITIPTLALVSTRTDSSIKEVLDELKASEAIDPEYVALTHNVFSKPINGHLYRGYTVLGANIEGIEGSEYYIGTKRPVWFVYSGMGSQWSKMGNDLMSLPIFAESIRKSQEILETKGIDLISIITSDDPTVFDNILHSFVGIAAIQIALTDITKALGIVPDGIIGHSVGELGCAYCDGALTAEEMILCAYSRGKASLEATLIKGMMAAVGLGYNQIKNMVPPTIEVACHNGPDSCTISGPTDDMEVFVKELQTKGVFARLVNVSNIAYHSRYIKPAAPLLLNYLKEVIKTPRLRSSKWISTSAPEHSWNNEDAKYSSPEYHTNNLLGSVLFEEGSKHIPKDAIVIEIAPHGLLQAILKRSLSDTCTNIPLTNRQAKNNLAFLLGAIGRMYLVGLEVNPSEIYNKIEFPVSKGTRTLAPLVRWEHGETWRIGIEHKVNYLVNVRELQISLNSEEYRECKGHVLDNRVILPLSCILELILEIVALNIKTKTDYIVFENLKFDNNVTLPKIGFVNLYAMLQQGSGCFEISADNKLICSGRVEVPETSDIMGKVLPVVESGDPLLLTGNDLYSEFQHRGHKYTGEYKIIQKLKLTENGSFAVLNECSKWQQIFEAMVQQAMFTCGENYQNIVVPKSILKLSMSLSNLENPTTNMVIQYNYATNMLFTNNIEMTGIKICELPLENQPIFYDSVEFQPFENSDIGDIKNIINTSFQLVLKHFNEPETSNIHITEIESMGLSILNDIKDTLSSYVDLNININTAKESTLHGHISQNDPVLFILNEYISENILNVMINPNVFILTKTHKESNFSSVLRYATFKCNDEEFSLLRKESGEPCKFIDIKTDSLSSECVLQDSKWLDDLKSACREGNSKVYLISNIQPSEGIVNFVRHMQSNHELFNLRYIFNLGTNKLDMKSPNLYNIFKKDPKLAVYKNGQWGSYLNVPLNIKKNVKHNVFSPCQMENKDVTYIGVNLRDETVALQNIELKSEIGNLDYVAVSKDGEKTMGLAYLNKDTGKFIADPILKWKVTNEKILPEDAVTIPNAYTFAFYLLTRRVNVKSGNRILIHSGCSPIGFACISVALSRGCSVYTTVTTETQRKFLKDKFYSLNDSNIFSAKTVTFESDLMAITGGLGVNIVINNLPGSMMQASARCMSELGTFFHIGRYDLHENNTIGMRIFLKYTSFHAVLPEHLFELPQEEKKQLQQLVLDGLYRAVVRPIIRKIISENELLDALRISQTNATIGKYVLKISNDFQINKLIVDKPSQFYCDNDATYFIFGGSAETWADMVEWLILRGARKLMISSQSKPEQISINRRLGLLQKNFSAKIKHMATKTLTKDSAYQLLSEAYSFGPIQAVFLLPTKSECNIIKSVEYLETALRTIAPKAVLINFVSEVNGFLEKRCDLHYPIFTVDSSQCLEFKQFLYCLDKILYLNVKNIHIKYEQQLDFAEETSQVLYKKLAVILPSADDIKEYMGYEKLQFVQLPSLGPIEIRALPPVFVLPGLSGLNRMKEFANKLLFPVFYLQFFNQCSISQLPNLIAQEIINIYPSGPYNLVAISSSGALAIEVGKILEKVSNTQITFIDAAPDSIQSTLKLLGEKIHGEVNLLSRLLSISNLNIIDSLKNLPSWESRLEFALENCDLNNKPLLKQIISMIKDHLLLALNYEPNADLFKGRTFLLRPAGSSKFDSCGLLKYCKYIAEIPVINGDHASMQLHKNLIDFINEYVTVK